MAHSTASCSHHCYQAENYFYISLKPILNRKVDLSKLEESYMFIYPCLILIFSYYPRKEQHNFLFQYVGRGTGKSSLTTRCWQGKFKVILDLINLFPPGQNMSHMK